LQETVSILLSADVYLLYFYLIIPNFNYLIDFHWWRLWYSRNVWLLL